MTHTLSSEMKNALFFLCVHWIWILSNIVLFQIENHLAIIRCCLDNVLAPWHITLTQYSHCILFIYIYIHNPLFLFSIYVCCIFAWSYCQLIIVQEFVCLSWILYFVLSTWERWIGLISSESKEKEKKNTYKKKTEKTTCKKYIVNLTNCRWKRG